MTAAQASPQGGIATWPGSPTAPDMAAGPTACMRAPAAQVGLRVLREDGRVFACHEDILDTVFHAEVGASRAILAANFTLDSLMLKYQGVDWADRANWDCNAGCAALRRGAGGAPPPCETDPLLSGPCVGASGQHAAPVQKQAGLSRWGDGRRVMGGVSLLVLAQAEPVRGVRVRRPVAEPAGGDVRQGQGLPGAGPLGLRRDGHHLRPLGVRSGRAAGALQACPHALLTPASHGDWLSQATFPPVLQGVPGAATSNAYRQRRMAYKLAKALTMALRGSACFDFQEYRERSHDLPAGLPDNKLWEHFVHDGQFEGRHFRWGCLPTGPKCVWPAADATPAPLCEPCRTMPSHCGVPPAC